MSVKMWKQKRIEDVCWNSVRHEKTVNLLLDCTLSFNTFAIQLDVLFCFRFFYVFTLQCYTDYGNKTKRAKGREHISGKLKSGQNTLFDIIVHHNWRAFSVQYTILSVIFDFFFSSFKYKIIKNENITNKLCLFHFRYSWNREKKNSVNMTDPFWLFSLFCKSLPVTWQFIHVRMKLHLLFDDIENTFH